MAAAEPTIEVERSWLSTAATVWAWLGYAFLILPTLIVIPLSFNSTTELAFPPRSPSFHQYRQYFSDAGWIDATMLSVWIAILSAGLSLLLGVPAAYGLSRGSFPGKTALSGLLLGPALTPVIVMALGLYIYFAHLGLSGVAMPIVLGHTLIAIPFVIVTTMSGMRHIDRNLEVAGMIMGGSHFYVFRKITLPLLRPSILASGLFAFLISFDEVIIAFFLSKAGNPTLAVKIFASIQWEISSIIAAISTLLTLLSLVICLFVAALLEKK